MKRFLLAVIIMFCTASIGICVAAESQHLSTKPKQVMVDRNGDGKIDGVDIYDDSGKVVKRGYDKNADGYVDAWETTDENTGMPIVTQSDKAFELR